MSGLPPWHQSRLQLVRALQVSQSTNKFDHQTKNQHSQPQENSVQLLHSRIAAVKSALLSSSTTRDHDCASHKAEGSALHATRADLDASLDLSAGESEGMMPSDEHLRASAQIASAGQTIFNEAMAAHEALDFASALPLFKLAGDSGHGASCSYAALYFIEGRGTAIDRQQAWVWACRGAELKDAGSVGLKAR